MIEKKTYSVKETADILGLGVLAIYNLCKTPGFPCIRVGKRIIIPCDRLDEWLTEQSNINNPAF